MYDALLFDLDGTLIDTESIALATGLAAFAAAGHAVDEAFMHRLVGRDEPTAAGIIRAAIPEASCRIRCACMSEISPRPKAASISAFDSNSSDAATRSRAERSERFSRSSTSSAIDRYPRRSIA